MRSVDLHIDVTGAAGLGEPATVSVTVTLPDALPDRPVVCFAKPGGGYSRGYYTVDLPGPAEGAQADWHAARGWIFVSVDHLGVGGSSNHEGTRLDFTTVAAGNHAAEAEVLRLLAAGEVVDGFPPVDAPLKLGIGQSMGGCLTVIQQGRYHGYDGIGVLGYSAIHTNPPARPGTPTIVAPWLPRDTALKDPWVIVNSAALDAAEVSAMTAPWSTMTWGFHYDDVGVDVIAADMERGDPVPQWASATIPGSAGILTLTPGAIAPEAAAVTVPVLVAMGERDVIADPKGEPRAYLSATSVDLYICPRMGHMHNFASTRELFWERIATWAEWVAASAR